MPGNSILVIDAETNLRSSLGAIFSQEGYCVLTATCIQTALSILSTNPVDLVQINLKTMDMDDVRMISRLHVNYPNLAIIILTANQAITSSNWLELIGVRGIILMPVDPAQILAKAKEVISKAGKN